MQARSVFTLLLGSAQVTIKFVCCSEYTSGMFVKLLFDFSSRQFHTLSAEPHSSLEQQTESSAVY